MKKAGRIVWFSLAAVLILLLLFTALFRTEKEEKSFEANVLKIEEEYFLITPFPEEEEYRAASQIEIASKQLTETEVSSFTEGERITVLYDGEIIPGNPAKLGIVYAVYSSEQK